MTDWVEHGWGGVGPGERSAADLFDPAKLEARLVDARRRREKALAARGKDRAVAPAGPSPAPLARGRRVIPLQGLLFAGGLAFGSLGAVLVTDAMLTGTETPPPGVATPVVLPWLGTQMPLDLALLDAAIGRRLPAVVPTETEPDPAPEPGVLTGSAASKARAASGVPATTMPATSFGAPTQVSIVRGGFVDGDPVADSLVSAPEADPYPAAPVARSGSDKPDVAPQPGSPDSYPDSSETPTATPPDVTPKPPPSEPPPATVAPGKPARGAVTEPRPDRPAAEPRPGRAPGQQGAGPGKGPPDHAQAHGRGGASGSPGQSRGGNGGRGSNGNGKGGGNGNGGGKGNGSGH